ncbi:MAG: DNA primase [Bacteroidetes bacterium]|nr:DNA primase [Bacteroidota bacterium]MBS1630084.1 DNA primase [Bacteroidota bacterium]
MIAQASVQEVLNRADIVEIIGLSVRLKKRGANYVANCPFHNEKTPSFSVSASKGFYKCFGCGRGGNVVTFVEEYNKLSFVESIHWLADFYKIELQETERSPEQIQSQQTEEALRILNEFAAHFFSESLCQTEEGKNIGLSYFRERGLRQETIDTFRLGYCDESGDSFFREAKSKDYSPELLEKAGLIRERHGQYQDSYRGRVIFPIQGNTGRVLGFGARILKSNDKAPKYVNTPENELYIKSRVLYGLYQARQAMSKLNECLLVEGYLDVISLHQAGIQHAVASSGTSLTEDQLRAIGHITKNLNILYDADPAGIKAALRGIDLALSQGFRVHLVLLPEGEDPDSFVQKQGKSGFETYVAVHKQDVIHFRADLGLREAAGDPLKKNTLVNEIAETISRVNKAEDFSLQQHYIRQASTLLDVDEGGLVILVNKYLRERLDAEARTRKKGSEQAPAVPADTRTEPALTQPLPTAEMQEWALVRLLLESGELPLSDGKKVADEIAERVDPTLIETPLARRMFDEYFSHATGLLPPKVIAYFVSHPNPDFQRQAASLLHHRDEVSPNWKAMHDIELPDIDQLYLTDADSTLCYFELKMLEKAQEQVMQKMRDESNMEHIRTLQMMYLELARVKQDIVSKRGTVTLHQPLK